MSNILIRRNVVISAEEAAKEFAEATPDVQAAFLAGVAVWFSEPTTERCRLLADELNYAQRFCVKPMLETLLEHLREPAKRLEEQSLLLKMLDAVQTTFDGHVINDVDGVNWFDLREQLTGKK